MSSLKLVALKKSYGEVEVLHGIDLAVEAGEFIVVVGPSGCGKSSLLRMVAGLEYVTSGDIYIADRKVNQVEPKGRDIAMVFQNYALYPHMSVYNNMAYGLKMRKLPKKEIESRVNEAAKLLQLTPLLTRRPSALSGGQRQRVAMGRAIVRKPVVFLFDEPLSNLDAKLRMEMRLEVKKLQRNLNITCLYVTHDQTEAMTMADRIVVLNKGYAEHIGTPDNVYHAPHTQFVAGFMGNNGMNFFDAQADTAGFLLEDKQTHIKISHRFEKGMKLRLGIRPEDVVLSDNSGMRFDIDMIEVLGADVLVHGLIAEQYKLTARFKNEEKLALNDSVYVQFDRHKLHFFDSETELRLKER
jgi:sn-glycerol 3-phosphate transport system ATP-binding protein